MNSHKVRKRKEKSTMKIRTTKLNRLTFFVVFNHGVLINNRKLDGWYTNTAYHNMRLTFRHATRKKTHKIPFTFYK